MAVSEWRACYPATPHGRDKSGPYISRNELRARDDEAFLCDEKHTLKPGNNKKKRYETYAWSMPKMAIHCQSSRDPISRVRRGGEGLLPVPNALVESDIASVDRRHTPSHEKVTLTPRILAF
jgi:hypothetical protein